ncbi:hypothetical protein CCP3SC5AM1_610005 [Gammaproteobacteria bacterium]
MRVVFNRLLLTFIFFIFTLFLVTTVFHWNWLRVPLGLLFSTQFERKLTFLHLDLNLFSWQPEIRIHGLQLANTSWGKNYFLGEVEKLMARIDLRALLQGRWVFSEIILTRPVLHLELSHQNIPNWVLGKKKRNH